MNASSGPVATGASSLTGAGVGIVMTWALSLVHVVVPQDVAMILGGMLAPVIHKFFITAGIDPDAPDVTAPAVIAIPPKPTGATP